MIAETIKRKKEQAVKAQPDKLDLVLAAVKEIAKKEQPTPQVNVDMKGVEEGLEFLYKAFKDTKESDALLAGIKDLQNAVRDIDVKPEVTVKQKEVNIEQREYVLDNKDVTNAIDKLGTLVEKIDGVDAVTMQEIVLDAVQSLFGRSSDEYINVRLTDGKDFYTGIASAVSNSMVAGKIDNRNTTSVALGIDGVYTGATQEVLDYPLIFINVYSDVASAIDGLSIQQSSDGINWDHTDEYTIPASTGKNYSVQRMAKYFRVVYTNGSTAQTEFRLQVVLSENSKPSSHRVKDTISGDDDVEAVKAALTGEDHTGAWRNVGVTLDGDLTISDNSTGLAISQGSVTGVANVNKFGNAPDFDTTDGEVDIWDGADDGNESIMTYTFSTTADIDRLSSSDAGDTQDIEVQGLDANYDLVLQTITLTGQTPVALTTPLIRVFRLKNVGATDIVGRVFCFVNGATTGGVPNTVTDIRAIIDNGNNQTEMAIYTVPAGKTGYIREIYASTAGGSRPTNYVVKMKIRPFGQVFQLKHRRSINDDKDLEKKFDTPEKATEKADIVITAETTENSINGSSMSAGFDIVLIDN